MALRSSYSDVPLVMRDYLFYVETIKGLSKSTVNGYYTDLKMFFRFFKLSRGLVVSSAEFDQIDISDISIDQIKTITLSDAYEFMHFITNERHNTAKARSRKVSSLRSFFKYLYNKAKIIDVNPIAELEVPSIGKHLPKFLSLEQSLELLQSTSGKYASRDYCMLTLFLNCGMRLSELVGINLNDITDDTLRLIGKGNKERIVYLNDASQSAIKAYLEERPLLFPTIKEKNALFLSKTGRRITGRRVEQIVAESLKAAGLSNMGFSVHKLRHTAATLMYQYGQVDIRALKEILGHANIGTTEIYTHVSSEQLKKASQSNPLAKASRKKQKGETDEVI